MITFNDIPQLMEQLLERMDRVEAALKKLQGVESPEADLITVDETCKLLGLRPSGLYHLVHKRKIPHMKQASKLYFSKREILDWINQGKRSTIAPTPESANPQNGVTAADVEDVIKKVLGR